MGKSVEKVNSLVSWQRQRDIIKMMLDGVPSNLILDHLVQKFDYTRGSASFFVSQAKEEIEKHNCRQADYIVTTHIQRYEELYYKLKELGSYTSAMNALQNKEKLLGMHGGDFRMKITNTDAETIVDRKNPGYDFGKLDLKQQAGIQALLKKVKINGSNKDKIKSAGVSETGGGT